MSKQSHTIDGAPPRWARITFVVGATALLGWAAIAAIIQSNEEDIAKRAWCDQATIEQILHDADCQEWAIRTGDGGEERRHAIFAYREALAIKAQSADPPRERYCLDVGVSVLDRLCLAKAKAK